jgi:hypothetical protein
MEEHISRLRRVENELYKSLAENAHNGSPYNNRERLISALESVQSALIALSK